MSAAALRDEIKLQLDTQLGAESGQFDADRLKIAQAFADAIDPHFLHAGEDGSPATSTILGMVKTDTDPVGDPVVYLKETVDDLLAGKANVVHSHAFSEITGKPTTLAGYGITDAAPANHNHDGWYLRLTGGTVTGGTSFDGSVVFRNHTYLGAGGSVNNRIMVNKVADGTRIYFAPWMDGEGQWNHELSFNFNTLRWEFDQAPYVGSNVIWHAGNLSKSEFATSGHTHALSGLSDTSIASPATNQVLRWNGSAWVNYTPAGGGSPVGTSRAINTGTGLTGGGNLSDNRTLSLDLTYTDGRYLRKDTSVTTVGSINLRVSSDAQRHINIYTDDDAGKYWHFVARSVNYSNESRRHYFDLMYNNGGTWQNILAINPTTRVVDFYVTPTVGGTPVALSDHNHDNTYLKLSGGTLMGPLTVDGGVGVGTSGTLVVRQKGDTANDGISLTSSASSSFRMFVDAGNLVHFTRGDQSDSAIRIDTSRRVGIRTDPTSGYNLTVAGGLNVASGTLAVAGNAVWHAGNDGSGSGLDADRLDGLHASSFALAGDRTDNYVWVRHNSTSPALYVTNQSTGNIVSFRSGTDDGTERAYITNEGNVYAPAFLETSSRSLKKDIEDFEEDALALVLGVRIRTFAFKNEPHVRRIGIIADETDLVFTGPNRDGFSLPDSLAITMRAVQQLAEENELLKKENADLRTQMGDITELVQSLVDRMELLEARV